LRVSIGSLTEENGLTGGNIRIQVICVSNKVQVWVHGGDAVVVSSQDQENRGGVVCVDRRNEEVVKGANGAEGGWGTNGRLRADKCPEKIELVP
jgi:hypothetical protein